MEPTLSEPFASTSLGAILRHLRTSRGFTLAESAAKASVALSTLSLWESDRRKPSGPALDPLLTGYGVSPRFRVRLLTMADPVYARQATEGETFQPPIDIGGILRGLRIRAKLSQGELAKRAGLTQSAVAKWENGDSVPNGPALHAALFALKASPEETAHILSSEFADPSVERSMPILERAKEMERIADPLLEVSVMRLERDVWDQSTRNAEHDLAYVWLMSWRAYNYLHHLRLDDAEELGLRALRFAKAHDLLDEAAIAFVAVNRSRWLRTGNLNEAIRRESAFVERLRHPQLRAAAVSMLAVLRARAFDSSSLDETQRGLDLVASAPPGPGGTFIYNIDEQQMRMYRAHALLNAGDPEGCIEELMKHYGVNRLENLNDTITLPHVMRAMLRMGQPPTEEMLRSARLVRAMSDVPMARLYWAQADRELALFEKGKDPALDGERLRVDWRKFRGGDGNLEHKHDAVIFTV